MTATGQLPDVLPTKSRLKAELTAEHVIGISQIHSHRQLSMIVRGAHKSSTMTMSYMNDE